jgi:hypothetical protein
MTSYKKICKFCDTEIEISDHEYGIWLPYSVTTGKPHICPNNVRRNQY